MASAPAVSVRVDFSPILAVARESAGDAQKVQLASQDAMETLAIRLQRYIQQALAEAVASRGRAQRERRLGLMDAIVDERNRRVEPGRLRVGFLNESWAGEVRKYYRGLEIGTAVHVGRYLRGGFINTSGRFVAPSKTSRFDPRFVQYGPIGPLTDAGTFYDQQDPEGNPARRVPVVRIRRPIQPYHYIDNGLRRFRSEGYVGAAAIGVFNESFKRYGIRLQIRAANQGLDLATAGSSGASGTKADPVPREFGRFASDYR